MGAEGRGGRAARPLGGAYGVQGEMLWVLHRLDDLPSNHDGSGRQSILRFAPVSFPSLSDRQEHAFERPLELCEFLVRKHSREGDLVCDFCGCTGTMSVAAIRHNRRWLYAESNSENYRVGSRRIAEAMVGGQTVAAVVG